MSISFNSRCSIENSPICEKTFKLRHELANIFCFNSYADYSLQKKMAKNYDNVMNFLNSLKNNI